ENILNDALLLTSSNERVAKVQDYYSNKSKVEKRTLKNIEFKLPTYSAHFRFTIMQKEDTHTWLAFSPHPFHLSEICLICSSAPNFYVRRESYCNKIELPELNYLLHETNIKLAIIL
ncbi:MAG: hypothetical protein WBF39_06645, partial [Planococcus donghaensis]